MDYYCATCGKEAFVIHGEAVRTCEHHNDTVLAPRTSVLYGEGGAEYSLTLEERIRAALAAILRVFKH